MMKVLLIPLTGMISANLYLKTTIQLKMAIPKLKNISNCCSQKEAATAFKSIGFNDWKAGYEQYKQDSE